jgi:hypothetical protein
MRAPRAAAAAMLACALSSGCAFVPQASRGLEEADAAYRAALSEPRLATLAAPELAAARELLDRAGAARNKLDDIAEVDHLAYLAKQRIAIGREAAVLRGLSEGVAR